MIVVAGDALADLVGDAEFRYQALPGGSCFNVAMALGRLGYEVGFASPLSTDALGRLLSRTLTESGVRILMPDAVPESTPLAVVSLDAAGRPSYAFYRDNTADRTVQGKTLDAALPPAPSLMHIGSITLYEPADSEHWLAGALAAKDRGALISLDPNLRAGFIADMEDYRRRLTRIVGVADIVKVSDEDLEIIFPGTETTAAFTRLLGQHQPALAVLTLGHHGSVGLSAKGTRVEQSAITPGPIVDTIGAGDSLQAGLIGALHDAGLTTRDALASIGEASLRSALVSGSLAAGINCTRRGCDPPWKNELETELSRFSQARA